ncbi:hypothetical protein ACS5PU_01305 [Pedobacter sp. GSP4]|uniref:hypothetical protein n=1 Tax=Pedobacter sp. GSP4 TaxID=3453716 RepID=UPI003EEDD125
MSFFLEFRSVLTTPNYGVNYKQGVYLYKAMLFYFGIMVLYIFVLKYLDEWLGLPPHKAFRFFKENSWKSVLLFGLVVAPLIEELTFRLALKYTPLNLGISLSLLFYFTLSILTKSPFYKIDRFFIIKSAIVAVFFVLSFLIFKRKKVDMLLQQIWEKYYVSIILCFAFLFALLHIRNLEDFSIKNLFLIPVIVFPQLVLAFLTSYFRIAYGLKYCIILHSLINAVPILFWLVIH